MALRDEDLAMKQREWQKKYRSSEKGRAALQRYISSEKGKENRRLNNQRLEAKRKADPVLRARRLAAMREYNRSEKAKAKKARYEAKIRLDPERLEARRQMQLRVRHAYVERKRAADPNWEYREARTRKLKRQYGLTRAEYEALLNAHGRKCAICGGTERLHVDHSHEDGHIRGILCGRCNPALGLLGDSIPGLERALRYLQERC